MINNYLKRYIVIRDDVPNHIVPALVAHATLGAHLYFTGGTIAPEIYKGSPDAITDEMMILYDTWLTTSFRECVIKVDHKIFNKVSQIPNVYLGHENTTLGGEKCIALPPPQWSDSTLKVLKFGRLWTPNIPVAE